MTLELLATLMLALSAPGLAYLLLLTVAALLPAARPAAPAARRAPRIAIVVPAHDEAEGIAATIANLRGALPPSFPGRIVVIADNCTDATALRARQAGADVIERHDPARRGKGRALAHAFASLPGYDWYLVIDADSRVDAGYFEAMRRAMARPADALQCRYLGLTRADGADGPRDLLAQIAWFGWNLVRPRGRARLGLSCGILGNGFALSRATLERLPYDSGSIVEDADYHAQMLRAGLRVQWVDDATLRAAAAPDARAAAVQRGRWVGGRLAMLRQLPADLRAALSGQWRLADAVCDLLLPPLALLGAWLLLALGLSAFLAPGARLALAGAALASMAVIAAHLAAALLLGGAQRRHWLALLRLPAYMLWALAVLPNAWICAVRDSRWTRTPRAPHSSGDTR